MSRRRQETAAATEIFDPKFHVALQEWWIKRESYPPPATTCGAGRENLWLWQGFFAPLHPERVKGQTLCPGWR